MPATDVLPRLVVAAAVVAAHGAIVIKAHRSTDLGPFRWVNTFIANVKTPIRAPTITLSSASTRAVTWRRRVNRRFNLRSWIGRLPYRCANTAPCPET